MKKLFVVLILFFLTVCSGFSKTSDTTILPGRGIGNILSIGVSPSAVSHWGTPVMEVSDEGSYFYRYPKYGIVLGVIKYGSYETISLIGITSAIYETYGGCKVGSSVNEVIAEFGENYKYSQCLEGYSLGYSGIDFVVDKNTNKICEIIIME